MSAFGARSRANLAGVHPTLVRILSEVTMHFDCTVLGGTRTLEEQKQNVAKGLSRTMASKHLIQEDGWGHAVDVAPNPQRWDNSPDADLTKYEVELIAFLFYVKGYAKAQGVDLRIGADWNGNNLWDSFEKANAFNDLDHIELP
jgi:hypothetical protein